MEPWKALLIAEAVGFTFGGLFLLFLNWRDKKKPHSTSEGAKCYSCAWAKIYGTDCYLHPKRKPPISEERAADDCNYCRFGCFVGMCTCKCHVTPSKN